MMKYDYPSPQIERYVAAAKMKDQLLHFKDAINRLEAAGYSIGQVPYKFADLHRDVVELLDDKA